MHVHELRVTIQATEEIFADTFVESALTEYTKRAKRRSQHDALAIEGWEAEEISHREQEDE